MRALTYFVAVSMDGRIAGPDGDYSAFPVEVDHIDAIVRDYPDTLPSVALDALGATADGSRFDTVLMGWDTYATGFVHGIRDPYPHLRQYVVSRSHDTVADGIELVATDPVETVRALKAEASGSGVWLCGGGRLAASLLDEIDHLILKVNPVIMGDGVPLFRTSYSPLPFELTDSTRFASGVVINEYARRTRS